MARSKCRPSISYLCVGVNWSGASVVQCRRQWYECGTVFEPSRSRGRLYLKRTWLAGVRVGVTRERRAISHGRGSHQGWGRARGTRGRERLRRGCGDVCRASDPTTVTLRGRGRFSVMGAGVTNPRRISSAITLMSAVRATAAPTAHSSFHVSNIEPSASCVANSGLRRENTFVKVAGHHRRLWSVDLQLQQQLLYCTHA